MAYRLKKQKTIHHISHSATHVLEEGQQKLLLYNIRSSINMKRIAPYFLLSFIFLVLSILLSLLFKFSLTNTWQALVSLLLIFSPLWILGWKQTYEYKVKHPLFCFWGKYCLILCAVGYLATVIIFVVGLV